MKRTMSTSFKKKASWWPATSRQYRLDYVTAYYVKFDNLLTTLPISFQKSRKRHVQHRSIMLQVLTWVKVMLQSIRLENTMVKPLAFTLNHLGMNVNVLCAYLWHHDRKRVKQRDWIHVRGYLLIVVVNVDNAVLLDQVRIEKSHEYKWTT